MGVELTMTVYAAVLLFLLVVVQAASGVRAWGIVPAANSRDGLPAPTGFHARMLRVVDNHREGLTLFAPLAIIAVIANRTNDMSALGAQLFFYSRVAHAIVYILGLPMIRPVVWTFGLVGTAMVALAIFGLI